MSVMTAPKKYLDGDRVEVNPEWLAWRQEAIDASMDVTLSHLALRGSRPEVYFPELDGKAIPDEGAWILVLEEPYTELRERFRVPLLSMWRARRFEISDVYITVGPRGHAFKVHPKQAVIDTPRGELHLWPHEYVIAADPFGLLSCEGAEIHSLGGEPVLDEDQMFYLQSRGIPYDQAVLLLIATVTSTDFLYVTFPEDVTAALEGLGRPLWRHIALNPRKSQGQKKA